MRGRFAQELLVAELTLRRVASLLEWFQLFRKPFAQHGRLRGGQVQHEVEGGRVMHGFALGRGPLHGFEADVRQLGKRLGLAADHAGGPVRVPVEGTGERGLRRNAHLGAQVARDGDDFPHELDLAFGFGVGQRRVVRRVGGERDRDRASCGIRRQALPQLLGDERHDRMQQPQGPLHGRQHVLPLRSQAGTIAERRLFQLQIPVTEFVPKKVVKQVRRFVIAVLFDLLVGLTRHIVEARKDPAVFERRLARRAGCQRYIAIGVLGRPRFRACFFEAHENEPRRVPNLVREGTGAGDAFFGQNNIRTLPGGDHERESHGVGAVFLGDHQGVDDVALGLRHLLLVGVADQSVNVDLAKRDLAGHLDPQHDHPGDPEKQNIGTGVQQRGGIEGLEVGAFFRPAHGGKRPQARAEPSVENVVVLFEFLGAAFLARSGVLARNHHVVAAGAIPGWNTVSPPELAGDAPVADVVHPLEVIAPPQVGNDLDLVGFNRLDRGLSQRFRAHEPLRRHSGLDDCLATLAGADIVGVVLNLCDESLLFEPGDDLLAGLVAVEARKLPVAFDNAGFLVQNRDELEVVALAGREVVGVVGGRDLDDTRSEFGIGQLVTDHSQPPAN